MTIPIPKQTFSLACLLTVAGFAATFPVRAMECSPAQSSCRIALTQSVAIPPVAQAQPLLVPEPAPPPPIGPPPVMTPSPWPSSGPPPPMTPGTSPSYGGSYSGGSATPSEPRTSNRSLFLALFAQTLAPGVATAVADWFRSKVVGNSTAPAGDPNATAGAAPAYALAQVAQPLSGGGVPPPVPVAPLEPPPPSPMLQTAAPASEGSMFAGIAYQVSLIGAGGSRTLVDPAQRPFTTGERFEVAYRPNFPGVVEVYNIDSTGREERIDRVQLNAVELSTLGPYEFTNVKGDEILRIVLHPCTGSMADGAGTASRGIAKVQVRAEVAAVLQACDAPAGKTLGATRSIVKVTNEGGTNFALDPVSKAEVDSGKLAPREVRIRFVHR